ncbi:hypothetical protein J6590_026875 [Homalodisca vitripennis]|nr:hypothetical protein J6590_026875 [Homalodisca vitripennis]
MLFNNCGEVRYLTFAGHRQSDRKETSTFICKCHGSVGQVEGRAGSLKKAVEDLAAPGEGRRRPSIPRALISRNNRGRETRGSQVNNTNYAPNWSKLFRVYCVLSVEQSGQHACPASHMWTWNLQPFSGFIMID